MEKEFSKTQVLLDLGLTLIQTKVYLALAESPALKVSEIAENAKVARPDVYSTLSSLHKKGLVEKILQKPLKYTAVPLNKGLGILLAKRTAKYRKIRAETQLLLKTSEISNSNKSKAVQNTHFAIIPKGEQVINRINAAIENAQFNIDLVLSWKRFACGVITTFTETMEKAWKRNVEVRFIVERPPENKTAKELIENVKKNPSVQIRFIAKHPRTVFGIYDEKEMFLIVFSKTGLPGSPALWSNNHSLIALGRERFEALWHQATQSLD